jgi:TolA-binding protein
MSLYRQLQSSFPASPQTSLSHVLLARLELGQGDPQAALTQFDAYLRQAPDGSLAQEALQGKAQALGALGRNDEEHDVWRELLRRFPTSPYAASARQRLGTNDKPE